MLRGYEKIHFSSFPLNVKSIKTKKQNNFLKWFTGFLHDFERQIIKNNKWSLAWVEVITASNRTQRVLSGCLSTANCCCNGAERRPRVSSGPSHFYVLVFPVVLRETLMHRNFTLLISTAQSGDHRMTCKIENWACASFRRVRLSSWGVCWTTQTQKSFFFLYDHVL